jgi:hypothetical protein
MMRMNNEQDGDMMIMMIGLCVVTTTQLGFSSSSWRIVCLPFWAVAIGNCDTGFELDGGGRWSGWYS